MKFWAVAVLLIITLGLNAQSETTQSSKILDEANLLIDSSQYEDAILQYTRGIALLKDVNSQDYNQLAAFYTHRAEAYNLTQQYKNEITDKQSALEVIQKSSAPDPILKFKIYIDQSVSAEDDGQLEYALSYLKAAERTYYKYRGILDTQTIDDASFYTRLQYQFIRIHEHTNEQSAILSCITAIEDNINSIANPHRNEYLRLASGYNILSDVVGANGGSINENLIYLNKALQISKTHGFVDQERIAKFNIAKGYFYASEYNLAIGQFQGLIASIGNEVDSRMPYFHAMLTMSVRESKGLDASSKHLANALQLYSKDSIIRNINDINTQNLTIPEDLGLASLWANMAAPYLNSYSDSNNTRHLSIAYQLYLYSASILDNANRWDTYSDYTEEVSKEVLSGLLESIVMLKDGIVSPEELELINHCREDFIWKRFVANRNSTQYYSDTLSRQLNLINSQIIKLMNSEALYKDSLVFDLKAQRDELSTNISNAYRGFLSDVEIPTNISNQLPKDSKLLRYYIENGQVYLIEQDYQNINLYQLPKIDSLRSSIMALIDMLSVPYSNTDEIQLLGQQLYTALLGPIDITGINHLIIIRDEILHRLPYEALSTKGSYLIETTNISYNTSILLRQIQNSYAPPKNPSVGVTYKTYKDDSNAYAMTRSGSMQLLGTAMEAQAIASITDATLYENERSNKLEFEATIRKHDIIHISTHAVADDEEPQLSHIVFDARDLNQNLYIEEITGQQIPAEMIVLSACETGVGSISNGDGVNDMSRAFTIAGSKSALVSLWQVPDEQSVHLMTSFYIALKKGLPRSSALADAKRNIIEEGDFSAHPYYWAAWTLVGADGPIWNVQNNFYLYILLLAALAVILLILIRKYHSSLIDS